MMKYTLPKSIRQSDLLHEDDLDKFISNLDAKYQGSKNFVFGDTGRPISEENMQASMEDAHTSV